MISQKIPARKINEILMKNYPKQIEGEVIEIEELEQGYMNLVFRIGSEKTSYICIIYNRNRYNDSKAQRYLSKSYQAAEFLSQNKIPVRTAYKNRNGGLISRADFGDGKQRLFGLYKFLSGSTIPWESYTRRHLRSLGRTLNQIHRTWAEYENATGDFVKWNEYIEKDSKSMLEYFNRNEKFIKIKLGVKLDFSAYDLLIKSIQTTFQTGFQLIHCDFVRGNILFSQKKLPKVYPITGVLDFEKVMAAPIQVDLARTLAFLLVDCKYKTREEIIKYFITEGYLWKVEKGIPDSKLNFNEIQKLVNYFWMRDLWKLLQCNPYEDLSLNFHYDKTVQKLIKQKLILSIDP
ncbi:phosphotransferase [Candidatus Dojkabacteria bacterium]|nr:phosphotransferase [Candidatus Dojkabacteria bacterium]